MEGYRQQQFEPAEPARTLRVWGSLEFFREIDHRVMYGAKTADSIAWAVPKPSSLNLPRSSVLEDLTSVSTDEEMF